MEQIELIALLLGAAWASGINLYAAILVLGLLGGSGQVTLPPDLAVLSHPLVLSAAALMYAVEFFADKTPGVDSAWDAVHTFIRIPAGALLALAAVGDVNPAYELAAVLLGGFVAGGAHATKAGTRLMLNASPEPVSNWTASILEDLAVVGALLAAIHNPALLLGLLLTFFLVAAWLLPRIARALAAFYRAVFRRGDSATDAVQPSPS